MKKRVIIGNWKTYKKEADVKAFFKEVNKVLKDKKLPVKYGVAPVFVHLGLAKSLASKNMIVAAQDANYIEEGAYTGTVSWTQLKDIGINHVIIGHSERRAYYNETDETVNKKLAVLLSNKMTPILCIGESLKEFESKKTNTVVAGQLKKAIAGIDVKLLEKLIIAYEPIWAIGTGKTATPEIAESTIATIRKELSKLTNAQLAKKTTILYGGSVKPANVEELMKQPNIDGALVGGASLVAKDFLALLGVK
ncbi:triose-phosphate isomerase [[Mycoplasma] testudinis]|uniref:triose-phosphate isomerase n=1 Tax=[Mycoplasma] testudinis TaxID=33924 RepID=UPI000488A0CF|nr:triose-phosphate isomerase [[Mycoplasma] testudinis]